MSGLRPSPELDSSEMSNGTDPPDDVGRKTISDKEYKKLNGTIEVGDGQEDGKEEKDNDDVKMEEAVDEKLTEAEALKTEIEDLKMEEGDNLKDVERGDKENEGRAMKQEHDVEEETHGGDIEKKGDESKEGLQEKQVRGQKVGRKRETKGKEDGTKAKELLSTPVASSTERPVRERKSVERLVEVLEVESAKPLLIEKGRGTPLKDIPNVAHKLAKKKPADLKVLHQTLFGRIGKAINYKNHILQFSGFVWHENEEKQRTRLKEKLDKCMKDTLLDFCDFFDLPASKFHSRKEELVAVVLDFMMVPHASSDVIIERMQPSTKTRKRKRVTKGIGSKNLGVVLEKQSRKKAINSEDAPKANGKYAHEVEDEEEKGKQNGGPDEDDDAPTYSESRGKECESEESAEDKGDDANYSGKHRQVLKTLSIRRVSATAKKAEAAASPQKTPTRKKRSTKTAVFKHSLAEDNNNGDGKLLSRKKKNVEVPKKKLVPSRANHRRKASGKKMATGKAKSKEADDSGPSIEELRKTICQILQRVDFNTATFTDIFKELTSHYGMDLTPRKPAIKAVIQEELTKLADEAEESEDDKDDEGDVEKVATPEPRAKKVKA